MPEMTFEYPVTIEDYLAQLQRARERVAQAVDRSPFPADRRLSPEGWSSAEILHHLYLTERGVLSNLKKMAAAGVRHDRKPDGYLRAEWEAIVKIGLDRQTKFTAPPPLTPTDVPPIDDLWRVLDETRNKAVEFVTQTTLDDLASFSMKHPAPNVGDLTGAGWVTLMAVHYCRHADQIEELSGAV